MKILKTGEHTEQLRLRYYERGGNSINRLEFDLLVAYTGKGNFYDSEIIQLKFAQGK